MTTEQNKNYPNSEEYKYHEHTYHTTLHPSSIKKAEAYKDDRQILCRFDNYKDTTPHN